MIKLKIKKQNLDVDLPIRKTLELYKITIVVRSVFHEGNKYCLPVFLGQCLYKLYMLEYNRIDVSEELMLPWPMVLSVLFVITGSF